MLGLFLTDALVFSLYLTPYLSDVCLPITKPNTLGWEYLEGRFWASYCCKNKGKEAIRLKLFWVCPVPNASNSFLLEGKSFFKLKNGMPF